MAVWSCCLVALSLYVRDTSHCTVKGSIVRKYEKNKESEEGDDDAVGNCSLAGYVSAKTSADIGAICAPPSETLHLKSILKAFLSFQYSIIKPRKEEMRIIFEVSLSKRYAKIIVCGVVEDRCATEDEFKKGNMSTRICELDRLSPLFDCECSQ